MIPRTSNNQATTNTQNLASFITQGDQTPKQSQSSTIRNTFQVKFQVEKTLKEIKHKEHQLKDIEDMIVEEQIQGKIKKIDVERILVDTDEDLKRKKAGTEQGNDHFLLNSVKQGLLSSLLDKRKELKAQELKSSDQPNTAHDNETTKLAA